MALIYLRKTLFLIIYRSENECKLGFRYNILAVYCRLIYAGHSLVKEVLNMEW